MRIGWFIGMLVLACSLRGQHIIDLSEVALDLPRMGIAVDSVFTAFPANEPIGTVMKGGFNMPKPAYLQRPTDEALAELLQRALPTDSAVARVIIKVNSLRITERTTGTSETAVCTMHLEFFAHQGGKTIRFHDHGSSHSASGLDVTHEHEELILAGLKECLQGAWAEVALGMPHARPADPTHAPSTAKDLDIPILLAPVLYKGIYWTYQDFRLNRPDTSLVFEFKDVTLPEDARKSLKVVARDRDKIRQAWGCSDGRAVFMNTGRSFTELRHEDDAFTAFIRTSLPVDAGAMAGYYAGAIVGGLFAGLLTGYYFMPVPTGYPAAPAELKMKLDMLTGDLQPFYQPSSGYAPNAGPPRSRHVFGYSKYSTLDTTLCLYVQGGLEACLKEEQYYDFTPLRRIEPVPVELRIGEGRPVVVDLDTNDADDQFFLIKVNSKGEITVDQVNDQMAVSLLNGLDPAMKVKRATE